MVPLAPFVKFTVPLVPPSVNHYKMRTRKGVTFVSAEAIAFKEAVAYSARNFRDTFPPKSKYFVEVMIYQGEKQKGDVDNYAKCVLDGLVAARVIHSDSAITDLLLRKRRDRLNPRTEITINTL